MEGIFGWRELGSRMSIGMRDFYSNCLVGGSPISIPIPKKWECPNTEKSNPYSLLVFKTHYDSNSDHKPNVLGDMAIPIYSDSNSRYKPNAPLKNMHLWPPTISNYLFQYFLHACPLVGET